MADSNSFDRLVSGLTEAERKDMLGKMKSPDDSDNNDRRFMDEGDDSIPIAEQLKGESLLLRLWLWIRSLISNVNIEELYIEKRLSYLASKIDKKFPGLIDYKRSLLLSAFYNKLVELKLSADFFRPYLAAIEDSEGDFYVYLGNYVMPQVAKDMDEHVDPYSNSVTLGAKPEIRMGLLRKMEDVMNGIPQDQKAIMYSSVRACEWLRSFARLPIARMLTYFTSLVEGANTCSFGQISSELSDFARIMCNSVPLTEEVLQALYLFSTKKKHMVAYEDDMSGNSSDEFVSKAMAQLSMINMFVQTVPLKSICCLIFNDLQVNIGNFVGGEDWFVKYKANWKRIFDQKWTAWANDCKKEGLRHSLELNFKLEQFPMLPERPWAGLWGTGLPYRYELTSGFLYWYFKDVFPSYELTLKTLMLEADFVKKDNRVEFTDAFNTLVQVSIDLANFARRISVSGDIGMLLTKLRDEKLRTLQGSQKAESLVRSAESDMASIIVHFGDASRVIELVLSGVFLEKKDPRYDGLSNFNHIQGKDNESFKHKLTDVRNSLANVLALIKELEPIDTPSLITK